MLASLHIENVAVIEMADIDFNEGFNVFTGETGAGKSIIIDAINMLLGKRITKDIIRSGATYAYSCGVFCMISPVSLSALSELNIIPDADGNIVIERQLSAEGRGSCRIGGRPVSVSVLKEAGRYLINIHGQNDNQGLLNKDKHIKYLDWYAELNASIGNYRNIYSEVEKIKKEIAEFTSSESEKERQIDLLSYQISEIEDAQLTIGEEEELNTRRKIYQNAEKIVLSVTKGHDLLYGNDGNSATDLISQAVSVLENCGNIEPRIEKCSEQLNSLLYQLEDAIEFLGNYRTELEFSPSDLDMVEERLDIISRLKRKYGDSIEEILKYLENITKELDSIKKRDDKVSKLNKRLSALFPELKKSGEKLSSYRIKASKQLQEEITRELSELDMERVIFKVSVAQQKNKDGKVIYGSCGCDKVEFLISVNPGEPPKPIAKIASGGELSRIMLAMQIILTGEDGVDTLIFDEIDTGISGHAANQVARKLRNVSKDRQLLCVTHLAQIAAAANTHYVVSKNVDNKRTKTDVKKLSDSERKEEIARIIAGAEITELTLKNAQEILDLAQE